MTFRILAEVEFHTLCFTKGVPIDSCKHVPVTVVQFSAESYYNASCTAGMDLAHFIMLNNELMNKDSDVLP